MVLRSSLIINKCIFNNVALSVFIFHIFFTAIFIAIFIFFILLFICFLCIYYRVVFCLSLLFSGSPSSSLFLILLINVRIYAFYKGFYLRAPKPGLKVLIYFNNIGFKAVSGVSNKVLSRAKYIFIFSAY